MLSEMFLKYFHAYTTPNLLLTVNMLRCQLTIIVILYNQSYTLCIQKFKKTNLRNGKLKAQRQVYTLKDVTKLRLRKLTTQ